MKVDVFSCAAPACFSFKHHFENTVKMAFTRSSCSCELSLLTREVLVFSQSYALLYCKMCWHLCIRFGSCKVWRM